MLGTGSIRRFSTVPNLLFRPLIHLKCAVLALKIFTLLGDARGKSQFLITVMMRVVWQREQCVNALQRLATSQKFE